PPGSARPRRSASGPGRAAGPRSVRPIPLLLPRVAVVVVAVGLPEAGLVVVHDPQATDPLGALPEVEVGDEEPGRAAVLARQRRALVLGDDPGTAAGQVLQREVGRVAAERVGGGEGPFGSGRFEQHIDRDAAEAGVEL